MHTRIIPNRKIEGISAILLPFSPDGSVDWDAFCAHVARTHRPHFSDCTTAPRHGLVSGCCPLDVFYKDRPEATTLKNLKHSNIS
jgi:hypothetical protein